MAAIIPSYTLQGQQQVIPATTAGAGAGAAGGGAGGMDLAALMPMCGGGGGDEDKIPVPEPANKPGQALQKQDPFADGQPTDIPAYLRGPDGTPLSAVSTPSPGYLGKTHKPTFPGLPAWHNNIQQIAPLR